MNATIAQRLVEVQLYGHLRTQFGRSYRLAVRTPGEAVRALCAVVPGFRAYVMQHSEPGYRVIVDKSPITADWQLHEPSGPAAIKIVPAVAGAAGAGKVLAGIALIGISFIPGLNVAVWGGVINTTWSSIALNMGISMALSGAAQMIAGNSKAPTPSERPNNQPSYAFNGPVNVTAQGQCVPLAYGRVRVGSVVISSGLSVAQLT